MNKQSLYLLRKQLDDLFYYSFDNLSGEQRLKFRESIDMIDSMIKQMEDF